MYLYEWISLRLLIMISFNWYSVSEYIHFDKIIILFQLIYFKLKIAINTSAMKHSNEQY